MLKKILKIDKHYLFPIILGIICIYVCYKNYTPGTYLTGWDTLHPEFNYGIYWKRIISGAWQSHQGLGSPASQAHASEIPRVLIIWILDVFFAKNLIRYLFAFLMLILGPLGVYFFLKKEIFKGTNNLSSDIGSFLGGLFYLLNLGTLQHFNVPLEMFLIQYAFLGWVFLFINRFYFEGKSKYLIWFTLITFFGAPQAHTPTLFYVYIMFLFIYLFFILLLDKTKKLETNNEFDIRKIKRATIIFSFSLLLNFFWLLPNLYYGVVRGGEVPLSKIHHLFSEEAFLVNKKYGNLKDISILKNFLFDWGVYVGGNTYGPLLGPWIIRFKNPLVSILSYFLPLLVFIGSFFSILKREKKLFPWLIIGFLSIFFILNVNPPFGSIFIFFQNNIPLFKELFRFPFTKFSILLMFVYSLFFGYSSFIISKLTEKFLKKIGDLSILIVISVSLIVFTLPAFKGSLINPAMRVEIPSRYFEMFKYFDEKEEYGRVLHLPIHSFWGWVTYSWDSRGMGYQGAGFLWFGIKQPLIDREFDRWNIANEQPYREISTAIYSRDSILLKNYLEKYKIKWLLLDKSVIAPGMDRKVLFYKEIENMFADMDSIINVRDFGDGLILYEYLPNQQYHRTEKIYSYYESKNNLFKEYYDPIYIEHGNYVSGDTITHPFLGFNSVYENIDRSVVYSDEDSVYFRFPNENNYLNMSSVPVSLYSRSLNGVYIDIVFKNTSLGTIPLNIENEGEYFLKFQDDYYSLNDLVDNGFIGSTIISLFEDSTFEIYKINEKIDIDEILYSNLENCDPMGARNYSSYSLFKIDGGFRIGGKNTLACVTSSASKFLQPDYSGLVAVNFSSDMPVKALDFCMLNNISGLCIDHYVDDYYFISKLDIGVNSYDLRFYTDARNAKDDFYREYRNVDIYLMDEVNNGYVSYSSEKESLVVENYLSFSKKDYLTVEPRNIEGNRRSCEGSGAFDDSNFTDSGTGVIFNANQSSLCDSYTFPLASHREGYVLEVKASFSEGVPLRICLTNEYSKRCDILVSLPEEKADASYFYLVPPMGDGIGYTVNVSSYVFGDTASKNELKYLSLVPIPYNSLKGIDISNRDVSLGSVYVLNEAYDPGWVAFCGLLPCKSRHVRINNWANGWVFEKNIPNNIHLFFWPQILVYIGIAMFLLLIIYSFKYTEKIKNPSDKQDFKYQSHSVDKR